MRNVKNSIYLSKSSRGRTSIRSIFLFVCMCYSLTTFAQGHFMVSGKIIGVDKEPIIGATIQDKENNAGVVSNADGNFTIKATSKNAVLHITYIGMTPVDIKVDGRSKITVVLEENAVKIDEVVVTALGIKRDAKALGYAVSSVNSETLTAGNEQNLMSALSGKVAGVDISSTTAGPSGSTRVIIRGNSQLSGSNQPLYVIDGMAVDNTELEGAGKWGGYDYGDVLSSLNPDDIENISILKGPSAAALYGSRASNGVVLITTKSASKKKGIGVEFSSNLSTVKLLSNFDDYQRVYGQGRDGRPPMSGETASTTSQVSWGGKLDLNMDANIYNGEIRKYGNVNNNTLSFFNTGITTTNAIAFNKTNDSSAFRVSLSDMRNWDIVPESELSRTSVSFKGNAKMSKHLTVEAQATYSYEAVKNRPALSDSPSNIGNALIGIAPNFNQEWLGANYKDEVGRYNDWNGDKYRINPYWVINEMSNRSKRDRLIGQGRVVYSFLDFLQASFKAGLDSYTFRFTDFTPMYTPGFVDGLMKEMTNNVMQYNFEMMLRFQKRFADFDVSAFVGGNAMRYEYESMIQTGQSQVIPDLQDITNYSTIETDHALVRKAVRSLFGQVSLGYKELAYIDATFRNDVSSTLSAANRSFFYPSISGSLIFSNLFEQKDWLTFGKLRASWAKVGGDTSPYQLQLEYGLKTYTNKGTSLGYIASGSVPNANLKPTSTYSFELGLDIRFFDNRLGLDMTYYQQTTKDQILSLPLSQSTGYKRAIINAGEISNKGIEASLSFVPVKTKNFTWDANVSFAKNYNEVVKLHDEVKDFELASARWANAAIYASEGQPYGVIVGKKLNRTEAGEIIYENGLPTFDDRVSVLGNGNYDFTLGFRNALTYKNLSMSVLFDMKFGADIYSMSAMQSHVNGTSKETLEGREAWYTSEQNRQSAGIKAENWIATGGYVGKGVKAVTDDDGRLRYVPNDVCVDPAKYWQALQTSSPEPFIYDNSFIKLREVSLSYSCPKKWFAHTPIEAVTLSAYGRNLLLIYSNVDNIDPESSYNNGNGQGFEYGSLPSRRTFGFGINVKF